MRLERGNLTKSIAGSSWPDAFWERSDWITANNTRNGFRKLHDLRQIKFHGRYDSNCLDSTEEPLDHRSANPGIQSSSAGFDYGARRVAGAGTRNLPVTPLMVRVASKYGALDVSPDGYTKLS